MIISFDIDNTLIPYSNEFEVEKKTLLSKLLGAEPLRKGTVDLFHELEKNGQRYGVWEAKNEQKVRCTSECGTYRVC